MVPCCPYWSLPGQVYLVADVMVPATATIRDCLPLAGLRRDIIPHYKALQLLGIILCFFFNLQIAHFTDSYGNLSKQVQLEGVRKHLAQIKDCCACGQPGLLTHLSLPKWLSKKCDC